MTNAVPIRRAHRGIRPATRKATYWTRERVLLGLKLFYKRYGYAPTNTAEYHSVVRGTGLTFQREFPGHSGVLRHFSSFREAWTAAGIVVDRGWEPWSSDEDWYLREATGILSRKQIAIDLRRSENAVHRRQYDTGLNARTRWGWTLHAAGHALKLAGHRLTTSIERGDLPIFRGNKHIYIDPADLIGLPGVDWRRASREIKEAAKQSLIERLAKILAGVDWRSGRIYQPAPLHKKRYKDRLIAASPKPKRINQGDRVELVAPHKGIRVGRRGTVKVVHFSTDRRIGKYGWRARVEFKKQARHGNDEPRIIYSIPLVALKKVKR
jgi:hypothetical protein